METGKLFKFWGDRPVMTGEGDSRAEIRESSLPEAKKNLEQTDGHSFARPGLKSLEEPLFDGYLGGIASRKYRRAGLHR